jgi:hypothetical protein
MSLRTGARYDDELLEGGTVLVYEGHDRPRSLSIPDPKSVDQGEFTPAGRLTENGRFFHAALEAKQHRRPPERVRVYQKILQGIWSYNGCSISSTDGASHHEGVRYSSSG